jgi:hypothetical protein
MASEKLTLTGPSGREYVWDKDTPPTPTDIAVLIEADRIYAAEQEGEKDHQAGGVHHGRLDGPQRDGADPPGDAR